MVKTNVVQVMLQQNTYQRRTKTEEKTLMKHTIQRVCIGKMTENVIGF